MFSHPRANRQVHLGDAVVGYEFQRSRRRTIGFIVGSDGLVVRAPRWVPLREVDAAVQEKSKWIVKQLRETRERAHRQAVARIEWCDGQVIPFLGAPLTVALHPSHRHTSGTFTAELETDLFGATLLINVPHTLGQLQMGAVVTAWLMRQARQVFTQRLDHFAPQLPVRWHKLSLSNAATRWGSAGSGGAVRLNWRLIHFAQPIIDYVVVHELSHLLVPNHSKRFWDTVRSVLPDYAAQRAQLKDDALPRWA